MRVVVGGLVNAIVAEAAGRTVRVEVGGSDTVEEGEVVIVGTGDATAQAESITRLVAQARSRIERRRRMRFFIGVVTSRKKIFLFGNHQGRFALVNALLISAIAFLISSRKGLKYSLSFASRTFSSAERNSPSISDAEKCPCIVESRDWAIVRSPFSLARPANFLIKLKISTFDLKDRIFFLNVGAHKSNRCAFDFVCRPLL